ncbi:unnamed protein product [Ectocarpus sp. 12 AP-2014]
MDELVSSLLLRGADKDALNVLGKTPLMRASRRGHLSVVHTLLAAGADVTAVDPLGRSALGYAARGGNVDVLEAIIGHGADVNARGDLNETALHNAARRDGAGAINALIEVGADINARANDGTTPLMSAAWFSRRDPVLALLERGASLTGEDSDGNTALHNVCRKKYEGVAVVVDLLLRWGADENALNAQKMSPAYLLQDEYYEQDHWVCSRDELDRASLLLARAQVERTWRSRSWLVMLRCRAKAGRASRDGVIGGDERGSSVSDHGLEEGRKVARGENEAIFGGVVRSQGNGESGCGGFRGLVEVVSELETETVFRTIVGFL